MTDHEIGLAALVITILGVIGTWLGLPQLREWWSRRFEATSPVTLGSLSLALPYHSVFAPGVLRADRETLKTLLEALPSTDIDWVRTWDFGGAFRWSSIEQICKYVWENKGPEHEFLDPELEKIRSELNSAILKLSHLAGLYTDAISKGDEDEIRKIPAQYENGQYSDRLFLLKSEEINQAADDVSMFYTRLVRKARLKLALSEVGEDAQ